MIMCALNIFFTANERYQKFGKLEPLIVLTTVSTVLKQAEICMKK